MRWLNLYLLIVLFFYLKCHDKHDKNLKEFDKLKQLLYFWAIRTLHERLEMDLCYNFECGDESFAPQEIYYSSVVSVFCKNFCIPMSYFMRRRNILWWNNARLIWVDGSFPLDINLRSEDFGSILINFWNSDGGYWSHSLSGLSYFTEPFSDAFFFVLFVVIIIWFDLSTTGGI